MAFTLAVIALAASSLIGALPITSVPIELLSNARFQIGIALAILGAFGIVSSATRLLGFIALGLAVAPLFPAAKLHFAREHITASGPTLRIASFNVFYGNPDPRPFHDWLERERPDVIALLEIGPAWKAVLEHERRVLPHQRVVDLTPRLLGSKSFAMALLSRHPIESLDVRGGENGAIPWLDARVAASNVPLRVIVLHALGPRRHAELAARNALFDEVSNAAIAASQPAIPTVVVGDFNATIYSSALARFSERSGLLDTRSGFGRCPSWFPFGDSALTTGYGWLGLDLDRAYVSPAIQVDAFEVGPPLGSDHRPVVAALVLPSATSAK